MLDALEQSHTWDVIDLWNVPEASLTRALLPELIAARGWTLLDEKQVVCPIIRLPAQFEDYVQNLDKKERHENAPQFAGPKRPKASCGTRLRARITRTIWTIPPRPLSL
jgi:hypothetical protein